MYSFAAVPVGSYDVEARYVRCNDPQTLSLAVGSGDATLDFTLPRRTDSFGYYCEMEQFNFIDASTELPLYSNPWTKVSLPFPFTFYGQTYDQAYVTTYGYIQLPRRQRFRQRADPRPRATQRSHLPVLGLLLRTPGLFERPYREA